MPPIPCDDQPPSLRLAEGRVPPAGPAPSPPPPPTAEQAAVIGAQDGAILVLAAVGSGKTTTLSRRVARALDERIQPERMLALTFTNRAAQQLRDSLAAVVGAALARRVGLGTFHALCNRVLRAAPAAAGLPPDLRVLDEDDALELMVERCGLNLTEAKQQASALHAAASAAPMGSCRAATWHEGGLLDAGWLPTYLDALRELGAVDFAGLVYLTRALLTEHDESVHRWSTAVDLVQVDEVQDTHLSEYEVLRVMASRARSLCLVGDLDQTIYSWRGSDPAVLLHQVEADFGALQRLSLTTSFRCSPAILRAADRLAEGFAHRHSFPASPADRPSGRRPALRQFPGILAEARWIARSAQVVIEREQIPPREVAVLSRTNAGLTAVSAALSAAGVPVTTVEDLRFFRRAEVKDALALARLVVDPTDEPAAQRVARALVKGVGPAKLKQLRAALRPAGLLLGDLLHGPSVAAGDPLAPVLDGVDCVVLDTETTGLDPFLDEVIEVAAVRLRGGRFSGAPADTFEALVKNSIPVGASEQVHHISDAKLAREGRPAAEVFAALERFLHPVEGPLPILGHNVSFDLDMLRAHGARVGVSLPLRLHADTLTLARRLLQRSNYKLGGLVADLGLDANPTHRALDDVLATVRLLEHLVALATPGRGARAALIAAHAPGFARLRETLDRWAAARLRPGPLIERIVTDHLGAHAGAGEAGERKRRSLAELAARVRRMDRPELPVERAMLRVLERAALCRDVDELDGQPGVRLLTMHQSKGLEFDYVFLPGLTEGTLPGWGALREGTREAIDEERRVLYVAMTRARRGLALSYPTADDERRRGLEPSRFLAELREVVDTAPLSPEEEAATRRDPPPDAPTAPARGRP
ncbi:MAG: UvrD-helicase domain-containing protein [Deltaproteobacteria bacterium]|nr:UvrD-helicase domain-containing protein [Deltaproteobacteria bacterium]